MQLRGPRSFGKCIIIQINYKGNKNMIYITKPGTNLQYVDGKSNMQLYELQVIKNICDTQGIDAELATTKTILSADLTGCKIVTFVSVPKFDNEFQEMLDYAANFEDLTIIMVSNDPRLKFKYLPNGHRFEGVKFIMLTNATRNIHEYLKLTFESWLAEKTNVYSAPLWTQPAFYSDAKFPKTKTYKSAFYCLHFKEMSMYRKHVVSKLSKDLRDDMLMFGNSYPEGMKHLDTIEASKITEILSKVSSIPVVLEEQHQFYGALTSRISEAIMAGSWPFIIYDIQSIMPQSYVEFPNGSKESYVEFASYMHGIPLSLHFRLLLQREMAVFTNQITELLK